MKLYKKTVCLLLAVIITFSSVQFPHLAWASPEDPAADKAAILADIAWLKDSYGYSDLEYLRDVIGNLTFPSVGPSGSSISWESADESCVDSNGVVTRPAFYDGSPYVKITATLRKGSCTAQHSFTVIVSPEDQTPEKSVLADRDWMVQEWENSDYFWETRISDAYGYTTLWMPAVGDHGGSTITWTSDSAAVEVDSANESGIFHRPAETEAPVNILATFAKGTATITQSFRVYICPAGSPSTETRVAWGVDFLKAKFDHMNLQNVTTNLDLPIWGPNSTVISWTSSDESVIAPRTAAGIHAGTVTRPRYSQGPKTVTLTATITKNTATAFAPFSSEARLFAMAGVSRGGRVFRTLAAADTPVTATYSFTVTVPAGTVDEESVWLDREWLNEQWLTRGYYAGVTVWDSLFMPSTGPNGSTIAWFSSETPGDLDARIVILNGASQGSIQRPAGDTGVEVTAVLSKNGAKTSRYLSVNVLRSDAVINDEFIAGQDLAWLQAAYGYVDGLTVTEDLTFPSSGPHGTAFAWASGNVSVIEANGTVHRPPIGQPDTPVTLVVTASRSGYTTEYEFTVTALKVDGDSERVALDKTWLTLERILNGNQADDVKRDLSLPTIGESESTIAWESSSTGVIANWGGVTRPLAGPAVTVTLTATISHGSVSDEKEFVVVVTPVEDVTLSVKLDGFANLPEAVQVTGEAEILDGWARNWAAIKVLQFQNNGVQTAVGSALTKIHLDSDLSFSAAFTFRHHPPEGLPAEKGGFTFTLRPAGDSASPSLNIGIQSEYYQDGELQNAFSDSLAVFYGSTNDATEENGRLEGLGSGLTAGTRPVYSVCLNYNGQTDTLEIRKTSNGLWPDVPDLIVPVDLGAILTSEGNSVQDLLVGFIGSTSTAGDRIEVLNWYFTNEESVSIETSFPPIYSFTDASRIALSANPPGGAATMTVTATVSGSDGPTAGVPVDFSTTHGTLSAASAVTDALGKASVTLSISQSAVVTVRAIAKGGAMTSIDIAGVSDADAVTADNTWLTDARILNGNTAFDNITGDLYLPKIGPAGSTITWTSNPIDADVVDLADGTVDTPLPADGDETLTLKVIIKKGASESALREYTLTVKVLDVDKRDADKVWLTTPSTITNILNGNAALDKVIGNLNLPVAGQYGSTISWASSNANVVATTGVVTTPTPAQGDKAVTLTATITKGAGPAVTQDISMTVRVLDVSAVVADKDWLTAEATITSILNGNAGLEEIIKNLSLPTLGQYGSTISWASDAPAVVAATGEVTPPLPGEEARSVKLTATIKKGEAQETQEFSLTVRVPDGSVVAADKGWLTSEPTTALILNGNTAFNNITKDLVLPASGTYGSTISWASSPEAFVGPTGTVTLPTPAQGDKAVTLTATITKGTAPAVTQDFSLTVKVLEKDIAAADKVWLNSGPTMTALLNGNAALDLITKDLSLPILGQYGSTIAWASSAPAVIATNGKVTLPTPAAGDQTATLTATITKGTAPAETQDLVVKVLVPEQDLVAADKAWLTDEMILVDLVKNPALDKVTANLNLPTVGQYTSTITWASTNTGVVSVGGIVVRPLFTEVDRNVRLTATIKKGTKQDAKIFDLVVIPSAPTDLEAVTAAKAWLDESRTLGDNLSQFAITQSLELPASGPYGSGITWASGNAAISNEGLVARPTHLVGHKTVTLTATISKNGVMDTKVLTYTVLALPDTDAPAMVSSSPANSSVDVAWDTRQITFTFGEEIVGPSTGSSIEITGPDAPSVSLVTVTGNQLTVKLDKEMTPGGTYQFEVPAGMVKDKSGNTQECIISFTVERRPVNRIEISTSTPADRAKGVPVGSGLSLKFNYGNLSAGRSLKDILLRPRGGAKLEATQALAGDTVTLTLKPGVSLQQNRIYEIVVPAGAVQDRFRNESIAMTIQFMTEVPAGGPAAPDVTAAYPAQGQTSVDVTQAIEITFSEAVSLNVNSWDGVLLKDSLGRPNFLVLETYQRSIRKVLEPYGALLPNTEYTLQVPGKAVKNAMGTEMSMDYTLKFTTGANALTVASVSPAADAKAALRDPVEITFSSTVSAGPESTNVQILSSLGNPVAFGLGTAGSKAVLMPTADWGAGETYTVNVPKDAFRNAKGEPNNVLRFQFTVASPVSLGSDAVQVKPSIKWLVNRPVTFDTQNLEKTFRLWGRQITSAEWAFGDGSAASGFSPVHTYAAVGQYNATLTVKDNCGITYEIAWSGDKIIDIGGQDSTGFKLSPAPGREQQLWTSADAAYGQTSSAWFMATLTYNGTYMPGENVKVLLYKNGALVKDLGTVVTGSGKYSALDEWGQWSRNDYGTAKYWLSAVQQGMVGTYEVVFLYGSPEDGATARIPVTVFNSRAEGALRIRLYDKDAGQFLDSVKVSSLGMVLNMKPTNVYGQMWEGQYIYTPGEVPVGPVLMTLDSPGCAYIAYNVDVFVGSTTDVVILPVTKRVDMVLSSVRSEMTNSANKRKTVLFAHDFDHNPTTPLLNFALNGDWGTYTPGYYEFKTDTGRRIRLSQNPTAAIAVQSVLRPGESLLARMVSKEGKMSPWVDTKVEVVPLPTLDGQTAEVTYEDGKFQFAMPIKLDQLIGSKVPSLDGIPMLDTAESFGIGKNNIKFKGTLDENVGIQFGYKQDLGSLSTEDATETKLSKHKSKVVSNGYEISAEVSADLYLIYNRGTQRWDLMWGEITLIGDGNYFWKKGYEIGIWKLTVGIYAKLTLGSRLGGTLVFDMNEAGDDYDYAGIVHFSPYVVVSAGPETAGLSVEGSIKGNIASQVHIPTGYVEVEPTIDGKFFASIFGHEITFWKTRIWGTHWDNGKDKVDHEEMMGFSLMGLSLMEPGETEPTFESTIEPMSRTYLDRDPQWVAGGGDAPEMLLMGPMGVMGFGALDAGPSGPDITPMKENVYPDADVHLVAAGNDLWLVWTDDNPARSDANRTQVAYSIRKDGVWSTPAWMGEDGTADFEPVAVAIDGAEGEGDGVLMAWQDIKRPLDDDAELDDFAQNAEISVTGGVVGSDAGDVQVVTLTDDAEYDHSPRLAADSDNALLVWTKSETDSDRLLYSSWSSATGWSVPAEIEDSLSKVRSSSLSMHGSEGLLLYTLGIDDGDPSTIEEKELFYRVYSGGTWGEAVRLAGPEVSVANPKAVFANGEWFVTWHQSGSIMYQQGLGGTPATDEFLSDVDVNYEVATGGVQSQVALVYRQAGEEGALSLSASFYDLQNGVWSQEIPVTDEPAYVRSFSPAFTTDGNLCIAYTQAQIENEVIDVDAGEPVELAEIPSVTDKVDLLTLIYTPVYDLTLDGEIGLGLSPEIPVPGTTATISATIANQGDFPVKATLELYDGSPAGGVKIAEMTTAQMIPARTSIPVQLNWVVGGAERSSYEFYAVVRPVGDVNEANPDNNTISLSVSAADVAIASVEYENLAKEDYLVEATITNVGGKSLTGITVLLVSGKTDAVLETVNIDKLDRGQEEGLTFLIPADGEQYGNLKDADGKVRLTLSASLPDGVTEFDKTNNTRAFVLQPAPITVESVNAAQGETGVGVEQPLTIVFSMNVAKGAEFDSIKLEDDLLNPVAITAGLAGKTLTVTPDGALENGTKYTLTVPRKAVGDDYGHEMAGPFSLSFTTTSSSPEVVFSYPGEGMEDVAVNPDLKVQFNQTVRSGPTYQDIAVYGPNSKKTAVSISLSGDTMAIRPASTLAGNTEYTLTIPSGSVQSAAGATQQEDYTLAFMTGQGPSGGNDADEDEDPTSTQLVVDKGDLTYLVTKQTMSDGSSKAIIAVGSQTGLTPGSQEDPAFTLDVTGQAQGSSTIQVNLSDDILGQLAAGGASLDLVTGRGDLRLPAALLTALATTGNDISITVEPADPKAVSDQMAGVPGADGAQVLGTPTTIHTAITGTTVVTLPLAGIVFPSDPQQRAAFLDSLAVFAIHSSGEREVVPGTVIYDANGNPVGLRFEVDAFSTFAVITLSPELATNLTDISGHWAEVYIAELVARGAVAGYPDGTFQPDNNITRAEFVTILVRALGLETMTGTAFADTSEHWAKDFISTAAANGIVTGYDESTFGPDDSITREEMAAMVIRAAKFEVQPSEVAFADSAQISPWALDAVAAAAREGIIKGYPDNTFGPSGNTTRAEAATVISRVLGCRL